MAQSRTLKLALLADIANFSTNMNTAGKQSDTLGGQFEAFGKKAALAFAAAGAAIGAYAKVAIENAAADEKAQRNLQLTIENTTNATAKQIAGVEDYISKVSLQIGVTDDELRPAFGRLVRSTKDVEDAQRLLNLALDISAATGKPLEGVANALGKAYDGNAASLGRLGLGIDSSILKSKDFDAIFNTLTDTFGGFAENEAQSTEKAFQRIKIAGDEIQEQIGSALLPVVEKLTTFILNEVVPVVQQFVNGLTGQGGLSESLTDSEKKAFAWGERVKAVIKTVGEFKDELIAVAAVIGTVFVVSKITAAVTATIALIRTLITAYNALKASAIVAGVATAFALNPLLGVGAVALAAGVLSAANALANRSSGGGSSAPSTGAIPYASGFAAPAGTSTGGGGTGLGGVATGGSFEGAGGGGISTAAAAAKAASEVPIGLQTGSAQAKGLADQQVGGGGTTINLTVVGAYDKEGTARTIVETLNNSTYRGGGGGAASLVAL
jgi:hypothetical protein